MKNTSGTSQRDRRRLGSLLLRPAFPAAFVIALLPAAPASFQSMKASLIMPSDLQYLGAFRLPDGPPEIGWEWCGEALTYYPGGDPSGAADGFPGSLFGTGHNWNTYISEISIPAPVISSTKNVDDLPVATTLQSFHDIRGGLFGALEIPRVGLEYLPAQGSQTGGKLYFAWAQHMGELETNPSHGWAGLNLAAPQTAGAWRIGSYTNYVTGDYLFAIPSTWAVQYCSGRALATGRFRDGGQGTQGPSLLAIAPWNSGNPPAAGATLPATPLLFYGNVYTEGSSRMTNYSHADEWMGGAWLTTASTSAVIFAGTKGVGNTWYGCSDGTVWPDEPPYPPACPERGWWSDRFESQILFYNPADLANVAQGTLDSGQPQPYAIARVDEVLFHITGTRQKSHLGSMAYDRTRGYLFIMEPQADGDKALIHVWKIKTGAGAASVTVTSPNGGESWVRSSTHNITWTTTGTVGNVKIEYSTNNGTSWNTIIASTANDGTHPWTLPSALSSICLVRVSATTGTTWDVSNAVFAIISSPPAIGLSKTSFNFGTERNGTPTPAETAVVSNTGGGTLSWTATSSVAWLGVTPGSGTGAGTLTIRIADTNLAAGSHTGTITVAAASATNSPRTITVNLSVKQAGADSPPFGNFATPTGGSTVSSSIPVTGWALDDIGLASIKIYRGTNTSNRVYIGDAVFVEGARPDVKNAYPTYPQNSRAGWGYMLLTNFLPNGGNGMFTLLAYARDTGGHEVLLGSKAITCDNAHAVKPFGAIDTPTQGGMASGSGFVNFGWALTPQPNSIPTNGSTIWAYVDGVALGHPTYNNYRKDIATLFPGYANSNAAIGYYYLDTTGYTDGVHTIAWSVADSGGNSDGIGSRYFLIQNADGGASEEEITEEFEAADSFRNTGTWSSAEIAAIPEDTRTPVYVRRGYENDQPAEPVFPGEDGSIQIIIPEVSRVSICLNQEEAGKQRENAAGRGIRIMTKSGSADARYRSYELVGSELLPLPIGASFDSRDGVFYWQPGPGFLGNFNFIIVDRILNLKKTISVRISPK